MSNTKQQTTLAVDGMTCGSCVRHVNEALKELSGVAEVDVRFPDGQVVVTHETRSAPVDSLIEALRNAGYESTPLET